MLFAGDDICSFRTHECSLANDLRVGGGCDADGARDTAHDHKTGRRLHQTGGSESKFLVQMLNESPFGW